MVGIEFPSFSGTEGTDVFEGEAMTGSLPAVPVPHAEAARPGPARLAFTNASSRVMLRLLPHLPDAVKRLLLGRRTVTIDGNTLDTTLQFMLAAQRSAGVNGSGRQQ